MLTKPCPQCLWRSNKNYFLTFWGVLGLSQTFAEPGHHHDNQSEEVIREVLDPVLSWDSLALLTTWHYLSCKKVLIETYFHKLVIETLLVYDLGTVHLQAQQAQKDTWDGTQGVVFFLLCLLGCHRCRLLDWEYNCQISVIPPPPLLQHSWPTLQLLRTHLWNRPVISLFLSVSFHKREKCTQTFPVLFWGRVS